MSGRPVVFPDRTGGIQTTPTATSRAKPHSKVDTQLGSRNASNNTPRK